MTEPVIIHIRTRKSLWMGLLFALNALMFLGLTIAPLMLRVPIGDLILACMLIGLSFAAFATYYIGLTIKKPIALRMDKHGISGFYTAPATWDEIAKIDVIHGAKGHKSLGFALHDPIAFRDRQSPFHRFTAWSNGRHSGLHINVPEILLLDAKVVDLAQQATTFHRTANGS